MTSALLTGLLCCTSAAAEKVGPGLWGENIEWDYNTTTKTLTIAGSDKMLNYSDPSRREWNSLEDQVEHLIIGDEVTYIGSYSFYDMDNLKDVVMGSSVTKIDNYAFKSCEKLTGKLDLKNVTYVGEEAFIYSNFTEINFGKVTTVEKNAFGYNNTIKSLSIPAGITFGRTVFNQCKNLETVYIDSNVSNAMFNECSKLNTVTIGEHATAIGEYAFYLTGIVNINVGKNVKTIGDWAFTDTAFKDIVVNADTIGYAAFGGENFTNIVFVEGDAVNINVGAITEKYAHFVYLIGANGWDAMEKSACWDGTKIQNVNLDISNGDIYCYKLDDGSYGYVNGRTFYRSDSNKITISQSTTTTSNKIYVVNGYFDITLNNINIVKVYDGWGIIHLLNGSSANFIIPEGTHSIVNNDGDTNDGWYASGIWAEDNTNVTISGTGKLDLYGSSNRSGLFSDGNVTINNVTLYSKGGPVASGIHVKKQLTINNSNVTAVGGPLGAGIRVNSNSTLVVNSGNVHATTGIDGAGIGGEGQGGNCGSIVINSGNVYARGGGFYGPIRGADIGVGGNGTTAKYLYISKNATVDAQYIGAYETFKGEVARYGFKKVDIEDGTVISNLIYLVEYIYANYDYENLDGIALGESVTFTAKGKVSNYSGLTYQWQKSADAVQWEDIPGAVADTYTVVNTADTNYCAFRVKVQNKYGQVLYTEYEVINNSDSPIRLEYVDLEIIGLCSIREGGIITNAIGNEVFTLEFGVTMNKRCKINNYTAFIIAYSESGKMVSLRSIPLTRDSFSAYAIHGWSVDNTAGDIAAVRVMVLSETGTPLGISQTLTLEPAV